MARVQQTRARQSRRSLLLAAILCGLAIAALAVFPVPRARLGPREGPALADVRNWGYQLQRARPGQIGDDIDLLVVDYSADGTGPKAFTRAQVEQFRQRPGGRPRIVLAYMSIGEAEAYRYYWSPLWTVAAPAWLGPENKSWKRNYIVRFWDREWQRVIFNPRPSALRRLAEPNLDWLQPYLDRIIEAGFDGVFLDRVDAYESWQEERRTAERDMVGFVKGLADYARWRRPGFLIVPQNAEELLRHADYVAAIDGVAKEDLLYGIAGDGVRNTADDVKSTLESLASARGAKLPVFVVEYLPDTERRFEAGIQLRQLGFVPHFTVRQLNAAPEAHGQPVAR